MKQVKIIEIQGHPHTLTQTDGNTFRLFSRQTKILDANLVSAEFEAEQKRSGILIVPIKSEETKNPKGGTK